MVHSGHCSELLATLSDLTSKQQSSTRVGYNTIRCDVACLSPVLLWPERVRGSCSVCVKAAVLVHVHVVPVIAQDHQVRVQWMSVASTQRFLHYHQSVALVHNRSVGLWLLHWLYRSLLSI